MDTLYSPIAWWYADVSQRYVPDKCNDIYVNLLLRTVHKNVCTLHTAALSKFFFVICTAYNLHFLLQNVNRVNRVNQLKSFTSRRDAINVILFWQGKQTNVSLSTKMI